MSASEAQWERIGDLAVEVSPASAVWGRPAIGRRVRRPASEAVRWLAAYALAMGYSTMPASDAVRSLREVSDDADDLRRAHAHLRGWAVVDAGPQARALELLAAARQETHVGAATA